MSEVKEQVTKNVKVMRESWERFKREQEAILVEIENLLGGGVGINYKLKHVEEAFAAAWSRRYEGERYIFDYAADRKQTKRLLTEGLTHDELARRAEVFLLDEEPGLVRARHPFLWFVKGINRYAGEKS